MPVLEHTQRPGMGEPAPTQLTGPCPAIGAQRESAPGERGDHSERRPGRSERGLPSSLQQRGHCRAFCLLLQNLLQFPSGHTNAAAESFWATLKKELIHLRPFDTLDRVRAGVFEYIEIY